MKTWQGLSGTDLAQIKTGSRVEKERGREGEIIGERGESAGQRGGLRGVFIYFCK
jgi:hypothetical protein